MKAKTGSYLKHIVFESPSANSNPFDQPTSVGSGILKAGFETRRDAVLSSLALLAGMAILARRREALWFVAGWGAVALIMNPGLIGIDRAGLIDESHWRHAVETAFAVMAGLGVGLICESVGSARSLSWNGFLLVVASALILWDENTSLHCRIRASMFSRRICG